MNGGQVQLPKLSTSGLLPAERAERRDMTQTHRERTQRRLKPSRTFQVLADAGFLSVHGDHRWVWSFSSHKRLFSQRQPHVFTCSSNEGKSHKSQTPILIPEVWILGHGDLFSHSEDQRLGESWGEGIDDLQGETEPQHVAQLVGCGQIKHQFLQKHAGAVVVQESWYHGVFFKSDTVC